VSCHPDGRTSTGRNFHTKASRIWTKGMAIQTVDLMHALSTSDALVSRPRGLMSGHLNFDCDTYLMNERVRTGFHIVWTFVANFPYLCFGKKSSSWSNTKCRPKVLLKRPDGCKLEQFEASRHRGRSRWKVLLVQTEDALDR